VKGADVRAQAQTSAIPKHAQIREQSKNFFFLLLLPLSLIAQANPKEIASLAEQATSSLKSIQHQVCRWSVILVTHLLPWSLWIHIHKQTRLNVSLRFLLRSRAVKSDFIWERLREALSQHSELCLHSQQASELRNVEKYGGCKGTPP